MNAVDAPVTSKKRSAKKKAQLKSEVPQVIIVPVPPPLDPAPPEAIAVSMIGAGEFARCCDVCQKRSNASGYAEIPTGFKKDGTVRAWRPAMREIDGEMVPEPFRVFQAGIGFPPVLKEIVECGRKCWDLWPIPRGPVSKGRPRDMTVADVLQLTTAVRRWLCPSCWAEVAEIPLELWLWEELDEDQRESAARYAERMATDDVIVDLAAPAYAEDFYERAARVDPPRLMPLAPEDDESIRAEVAAYCREHGLTM